jgi:histidyl-tRNA synthetase
MREFYQCDFDISGVYDTMVADSQCLVVVVEALRRLGLGGFKVKLNHRKILDGMFESCGVPDEMIRTISSAVDKLDKMEWQLVKEEMLEKGLDGSVADKIGVFVKYKTRDSLDQLLKTELKSNVAASNGI